MPDSQSSPRPSALGDPMEAWKARGRELNALYEVIEGAVAEPAPDEPLEDLKRLVAERDALREALIETRMNGSSASRLCDERWHEALRMGDAALLLRRQKVSHAS